MPAVDPAYAIALKNDALYLRGHTTTPAWAAARETKGMSPLAQHDEAVAEVGRQLVFLGGALVRDRAVVRGARRDLVGKPITLTAPGLGYEAGVVAFVIGAAEAEATTVLTVIRRIA